MSNTKILKTEHIQLHGLESEWLTKTTFKPKPGQLVVYDCEVDSQGNTLDLTGTGRTEPYTYSRIKIGDGINSVSQLPFIDNINSIPVTVAKMKLSGNVTPITDMYTQSPYSTINIEGTESTDIKVFKDIIYEEARDINYHYGGSPDVSMGYANKDTLIIINIPNKEDLTGWHYGTFNTGNVTDGSIIYNSTSSNLKSSQLNLEPNTDYTVVFHRYKKPVTGAGSTYNWYISKLYVMKTSSALTFTLNGSLSLSTQSWTNPTTIITTTVDKNISVDYYKVIDVLEITDTLQNDVSKKVDDKNYSTEIENPEDGNWGYTIGLYGKRSNNTSALFKATKQCLSDTIPVRDSTGAISVGINIKDKNGNNYVGGAAPHTWVVDKFNDLNGTIYAVKDMCYNYTGSTISSEAQNRQAADAALQTTLNTLSSTITSLTDVVNAKKITKITLEANSTIPLKINSLYAILNDSDSVDNNYVTVEIKGDTSNTVVGPNIKFGLMFLPNNTMGNSEEYPSSYYGLILYNKTITIANLPLTSIGSHKITINKEDYVAGKLVLHNNSDATFSIWELSL